MGWRWNKYICCTNLQGEFLRGYSTSSTNSRTNGVSTAAVGIHQDATYLPYMYTRLTPDGNGVIVFTKLKLSSNNDTYSGNMDLANIATGTNLYQVGVTGNGVNVTWQNSGYAYNYTTRPTNTTVLYCIKY